MSPKCNKLRFERILNIFTYLELMISMNLDSLAFHSYGVV
jgi:hypothetical protein